MRALFLFGYIMTDEVIRLRRLRKTALKVRALTTYLNPGSNRAAVLLWHISRIATGRLRSHPYESYQSDQGVFETTADRCIAYLGAAFAKMRRQGMRHLLGHLIAASRELDDTRALTLSAELSETLGRAQLRMREVIEEVRAHVPEAVGRRLAQRGDAGAQVSSPYLAL